ncbi:hypothetical protein JYK02_25140 [Corallococcus macrosporus]|uniref:Uncharacterized protein n=1 Tax=Corallococcus macrosporus TaxID=35 RepID=A0ABS3DHL7_9BACT|nr:hypothetical protein [Corallococcus macrosporus]MBN8230805.1 hypothetical protein [Corallococcus macrosporus]
MNRIVWSVGGTGVVLSCLAVAWLHRPLDLPAEPPAPPPTVSQVAPAPSPTVEAAPIHTPAPAPAIPEPLATPSPEAFLDAALKVKGPVQPELRNRARRELPDTRVRLVRALRADHPTPLARRDAVLAELTASGDSSEPWTHDARAALDAWHARIDQDVRPVQAEPPHCYAAGCVTRVTFPDEPSFRDAWERASLLTPSAHSAHLQLPPEHLPSGEVRVPWLVLRPDRS